MGAYPNRGLFERGLKVFLVVSHILVEVFLLIFVDFSMHQKGKQAGLQRITLYV